MTVWNRAGCISFCKYLYLFYIEHGNKESSGRNAWSYYMRLYAQDVLLYTRRPARQKERFDNSCSFNKYETWNLADRAVHINVSKLLSLANYTWPRRGATNGRVTGRIMCDNNRMMGRDHKPHHTPTLYVNNYVHFDGRRIPVAISLNTNGTHIVRYL